MIDEQKLQADLKSHHIEGIAREGNTEFSCPLITPIDDQFWQGGCVGGVDLQGCYRMTIDEVGSPSDDGYGVVPVAEPDGEWVKYADLKLGAPADAAGNKENSK